MPIHELTTYDMPIKTSQILGLWKQTNQSLKYLTPGISNTFFAHRFTYIQMKGNPMKT